MSEDVFTDLGAIPSSVLELLHRWESRAHDTMGVLADNPELVVGKPWDRADYIHVFRVQKEGVFLDIALSGRRISAMLHGLSTCSAQAHPWGTAIVMGGKLHWIGTQTRMATGFVSMAARVLPRFGFPRAERFTRECSQVTLVLPCTWRP